MNRIIKNGFKLPATNRSVQYSEVLTVIDPSNKHHPYFTIYNPMPISLELGAVFKLRFCGGEGGFIVNEIGIDTKQNPYIKGCRWFGINQPIHKRTWGKNPMLKLPLSELTGWHGEYKPIELHALEKLQRFSRILSAPAVQHLESKI